MKKKDNEKDERFDRDGMRNIITRNVSVPVNFLMDINNGEGFSKTLCLNIE